MPLALRSAVAALALALPGLAAAQYFDPPPDRGPGKTYALATGGLFIPRGVSLEGFRTGSLVGAVAGYQFGSGFALELGAKRATAEGPYRLELTQDRILLGLRGFAERATHARYLSVAFGWFTSDVRTVVDGTPFASQEGRLGVELTAGLLVRATRWLGVGAEVSYGGAYATLYDGPTFISGFGVTLAARVALPGGA
jgi:hypothetical protein